MSEQMIHIEEEFKDAMDKAEEAGRRRVEELSVRGDELKETLVRLGKEATVRKITIKSRSGRTLAEIPLALGALGVFVLGPATAALLAAAWLTRVSVLIEHVEAPAAVESEPGAAIRQIETRIA